MSEWRTDSSIEAVFRRSYSWEHINNGFGVHEHEPLTIKTTRPRSPDTFRCRFAISSLKGTTTVHPVRAATQVRSYTHLFSISLRTKSVDDVSSQEPCCPKDSCSVPFRQVSRFIVVSACRMNHEPPEEDLMLQSASEQSNRIVLHSPTARYPNDRFAGPCDCDVLNVPP